MFILPSWYILQTFGPAFVAIKSIPSVNISPAHKIDMAMLRACICPQPADLNF